MIYWLYLVQYLHLTEAIGVCFEYLLHGGHRSNDPFLGSSICWWWWHLGLKGGLWWLFCITLVDSLALPLFIYRGHVCGISWELAVNYRWVSISAVVLPSDRGAWVFWPIGFSFCEMAVNDKWVSSPPLSTLGGTALSRSYLPVCGWCCGSCCWSGTWRQLWSCCGLCLLVSSCLPVCDRRWSSI